MTKAHIEKLLIVLSEGDARQIIELARQNDSKEILQFLTLVLAKKVESALRMRCG